MLQTKFKHSRKSLFYGQKRQKKRGWACFHFCLTFLKALSHQVKISETVSRHSSQLAEKFENGSENGLWTHFLWILVNLCCFVFTSGIPASRSFSCHQFKSYSSVNWTWGPCGCLSQRSIYLSEFQSSLL